MKNRLGWQAMVLLAWMTPADASAAERDAVMVLNVRPQGKGLAETAGVLTDLVLQDLHDTKKFRVIGQKDVNQMLSLEQQKQLAGCNDTGCLVEIAGAMGTRFTVDGTLGAVGASSVLSLTLIDVSRAAVMGKKTAVVKGERENLLVEVHKLVRELMAPAVEQVEQATKAGTSRMPPGPSRPSDKGVAAAVKAAQPGVNPLVLWGHVSFWTGLAAAGAGGVFTMLASSANDDYADGKDPITNRDAVGRNNALAVTGYALGGALMATGVTLWFLSPGDETGAQRTAVTIQPGVNGNGTKLVLSASW
ncbi:MAG: hypothetical protein HY897_17405 [Deltaproteobacteria bacterium]|nr:hypothetical protein [Deltaproteobacteria bacterium]